MWKKLLPLLCIQLTTAYSALVVMRHGEGEHNPLDIYSSWTKSEGGADHRLTEKGKQQVFATAQTLLAQGINAKTVGRVLVSPLRRTRQTAQILVDSGVCSAESIIIDERIREPLSREWEGHRHPPRQPGDHSWHSYVVASSLHGGETPEEVQTRMSLIAAELAMWDPSKGHVIIVTHGYPSSILFQIYGQDVVLGTAEARILP